MINDITTMPEMTVILTPAASGVNIKTELRNQYSQILPLLNDPNDRLLKLIFVKNILYTQDLSEEDRLEMEKAAQLLISTAAMQMAIQYKQLDNAMKQMQMPPQPPPEQGGAVTEGGFDQELAIQATPQEGTPPTRRMQIAQQPQPQPQGA